MVKNKGNNIASKGDSGWEDTFTWNKYKDSCGTNTPVEGDVYLMYNYHKSGATSDEIRLVSTSGAKNTGLKLGENHLKCYYTSGTR